MVLTDCGEMKFIPWDADGVLEKNNYEIGTVSHCLNGCLNFDLLLPKSKISYANVKFEAPLAVRVVQEGSLMEYWSAGVIIKSHNFFTIVDSEFKKWLEFSSGGVHPIGKTKHFAIFTDDICLEVISNGCPIIAKY